MNKKIIISPEVLDEFKNQNQLKGTVEFLDFIKTIYGYRAFAKFCVANNIPLTERPIKSVIFHGSPKKHALLTPNASIGGNGVAEQTALVYATDIPNYAIFLALLHLDRFGEASVQASSKKIQLSVNLGFVNGASKLKSGYIHVVSSDAFKKMPNNEYQTKESVPILFSIPVSPEDLTIPITIKNDTLQHNEPLQ